MGETGQGKDCDMGEELESNCSQQGVIIAQCGWES